MFYTVSQRFPLRFSPLPTEELINTLWIDFPPFLAHFSHTHISTSWDCLPNKPLISWCSGLLLEQPAQDTESGLNQAPRLYGGQCDDGVLRFYIPVPLKEISW